MMAIMREECAMLSVGVTAVRAQERSGVAQRGPGFRERARARLQQ